jgi:hypothetical protein
VVTASDLLAERIPDEGLRRMAFESSDEPVSVIIELAVPDLQVEYAKAGRDGPYPARVRPPTDHEQAHVEKTASDAKRFLEDLLPEPPVYLRSARALVATATGKELNEIARQGFTKRIERNRVLPA